MERVHPRPPRAYERLLGPPWRSVVLRPGSGPGAPPGAERDEANPGSGREARGDAEGEVVHLLGSRGADGVLRVLRAPGQEAPLTFGPGDGVIQEEAENAAHEHVGGQENAKHLVDLFNPILMRVCHTSMKRGEEALTRLAFWVQAGQRHSGMDSMAMDGVSNAKVPPWRMGSLQGGGGGA